MRFALRAVAGVITEGSRIRRNRMEIASIKRDIMKTLPQGVTFLSRSSKSDVHED